jgi:thiamine biosynthesis lipoprotein
MRTIALLAMLVAAIVAVAWWIARHDPAWRVRPPADPPHLGVGGRTMGGTWSVRYARTLNPAETAELFVACQAALDRIEMQMSTWLPESDLSKFNASASTDWQPVPRELAEVVVEAQRIAEQTNGVFDITVAPVVNAWGFGPQISQGGSRRVPDRKVLDPARAAVGYRQLEARLTPPSVRKTNPSVQIDLSAIAQGYAVDRLMELMQARGFGDVLVEVCGEVRAAGNAPAGRPWQIGIETPKADTFRVYRRVRLVDIGLATSGGYRNYFDSDGVRYSHEIEPRTGEPVRHALAAVSVAHPSAATADALATALLVMGPEEGPRFATAQGIDALFVARQGDRFVPITTGNFADCLLPADAEKDDVDAADTPKPGPTTEPRP